MDLLVCFENELVLRNVGKRDELCETSKIESCGNRRIMLKCGFFTG